jgi:hypothetical protein
VILIWNQSCDCNTRSIETKFLSTQCNHLFQSLVLRLEVVDCSIEKWIFSNHVLASCWIYYQHCLPELPERVRMWNYNTNLYDRILDRSLARSLGDGMFITYAFSVLCGLNLVTKSR